MSDDISMNAGEAVLMLIAHICNPPLALDNLMLVWSICHSVEYEFQSVSKLSGCLTKYQAQHYMHFCSFGEKTSDKFVKR